MDTTALIAALDAEIARLQQARDLLADCGAQSAAARGRAAAISF